MNKNIMKKWVKALRSGKYRKTSRKLCRITKNGNKSWCCLGVLTDLYNKEHKKHQVSVEGGLLPNKVEQWSGMCSWGGKLHYNGASTALTNLNDCTKSKRSFSRMADIIEKNWEQL
jgi:hypothetical protein